jgi:hypothetical protein
MEGRCPSKPPRQRPGGLWKPGFWVLRGDNGGRLRVRETETGETSVAGGKRGAAYIRGPASKPLNAGMT